MDTIESRDITELVAGQGWALALGGDGQRWARVVATLHPDGDSDPREDGDWAGPDDVAAWQREDWQYVLVRVSVQATAGGFELGSSALGAVVEGTLPATDTRPAVVCDPLRDDAELLEIAADALHDASGTLEGLQGLQILHRPVVSLVKAG